MNLVTYTLSKLIGVNTEALKLQNYSMRFGVELRKVTRMERVRENELHVMFFNGHQFEVHALKGASGLLNDVVGALGRNGAVDMNKIGLYL